MSRVASSFLVLFFTIVTLNQNALDFVVRLVGLIQ